MHSHPTPGSWHERTVPSGSTHSPNDVRLALYSMHSWQLSSHGYVASLRFLKTGPSSVHSKPRAGDSLPRVDPIQYGARGVPFGFVKSGSNPDWM